MKELRDCCRYLQIDCENEWDKKKIAEVLAWEFKDHPEYFLIVLEKDGFTRLLEFVRKPVGKLIIDEEEEEDIGLWFTLGLLDIQIKQEGTEVTARLSLLGCAGSVCSRNVWCRCESHCSAAGAGF